MFVCTECGRSYPAAGFCTEDGGRLGDAAGDELLGKMVGSYRIASLLGKGGMGSVYKAVHPNIGSRVALKLLSQECAAHPALVERFFAEARAVNLIRHENIVSVLDLAATADGRPYIEMEYLEGAPLARHMRRGGVPLGTLGRLIGEILDALEAAHQKGIVHRDLKPDNVFVTAGGRVKILDFGIAKLKPEMGGISQETRTGSLLGTPQYMSPEQARGAHVDHRSDLYSTGVILFEGATGQRPFPAQTLYELLKAHVEEMPPAPSMLRADIPRELENVLLHALQKDPDFRYQSARDFRVALDHALAYLGPEAFAPLGDASPHGAQAMTAAPHSPAALPTPQGSYATPMPITPQAHVAPYAPVATPHWGAPAPAPLVMPYEAYGAPMMLAPPPPAAKSYAWVWIVVGAIVFGLMAFMLMTCGACAAAC